jgi:hypothetical protein
MKPGDAREHRPASLCERRYLWQPVTSMEKAAEIFERLANEGR